MIDKESWKIGTGCNKTEELIKYNRYIQYHKSVFLKKTTSSSNVEGGWQNGISRSSEGHVEIPGVN